MSLYQCEKCGCVENTACGFYHCSNSDLFCDYQEGTKKGMKLCCECGPLKLTNGKPTGYGKWHDCFVKAIYPFNSLYTDDDGNVKLIKTNEYPSKEDRIK